MGRLSRRLDLHLLYTGSPPLGINGFRATENGCHQECSSSTIANERDVLLGSLDTPRECLSILGHYPVLGGVALYDERFFSAFR